MIRIKSGNHSKVAAESWNAFVPKLRVLFDSLVTVALPDCENHCFLSGVNLPSYGESGTFERIVFFFKSVKMKNWRNSTAV